MPYKEQIPIDKGIDNSLAMMREGYLYISNRRKRFGKDIFETRLLGGQKAVCIAGEEAVKVFYDESKIKRQGAAPKRIRQTLFGEKAIQTIDDTSHKHRKQLFMSLMTEKQLQDVVNIFKKEWASAIDKWESENEVILYHEVTKILAITACKWAGVPLSQSDASLRASQLEKLFDSAAAIGPRHWKGRQARNALELWLQKIIKDVRNSKLETPEETALHRMAWYRDTNGKLLNTEVTAVEVLNILRPIVAISVYIVFAALALFENPEEKEKLLNGDEDVFELFIQEVRRYYPFFPFTTGRVRENFLWKGHDFKKESLVLLDIYGTNHHPNLWDNPEQFTPDRFKEREESPYDLIPQGGGDYYKGHRCPGEWLTVEVMKSSLDLLVNHMEYNVPKQQNLRYSMMRIPSLPKDRFIMDRVKKV
ncbi:cytochrome P450 [Alkalibacillus salilacus]|uniref:Fatty-acid peroxygenase n=1 Tax=Alkalibacillus salilacus TaxID=284582 RepID=A0ABT9VDJ2_9BACI|nr:cytochrome P450 [Alkalibacillus salilacus]MDQ0158945.1 fatty-acid peroxygenase [Alkalibacillus salilacus]